MPEDRLIWSEEFSSGEGSVPDPKIWGRDLGDGTSHGIPGWGNNELQYYTAKRTKNARIENGILTIEAHKEDYEGKGYTSARLVTRDKASWNHGKIEIKANI